MCIRDSRHGPAGRLLIATCKAFAVGAGILLILMAAMTLASIVGRTFLGSPILGDYELVQVLCAMAVSMSLPYCQIARGHVIVDFFTTRTPASVNRVLDVAAGLLLAGLAFVVAWRLAIGMVEKRGHHAGHLFQQSAGEALREALAHRGYVLLTVGFFVCGFQVVFVGVHLPAYLADRGFPAHVAVVALALVGLTTNHCVSTTARMAGNLGFATFVAADATATFDRINLDGQMRRAEDVHNAALSDLQDEFAEIVDTRWLIDALNTKHGAAHV